MTLIKTDSMQSRSDQAGNHGNRKGKKPSQLSKGDCCLTNMILQHNPRKEMTLQK
jgi:hypothetical protein